MTGIPNKRLDALDAYWRAANYLSIGQIYLRSNPLLKEPLKKEHIKARLLGHWGTSPGLNLIYAHLNRLIQDTDAQVLYITGPGHGGPALRANVFLEGSMSEIYPNISRSIEGIEKLMLEFSWPGGVPSHVSPPTPGSIHEGGELGYSLVHAFGSVMDNPDLLAVCVVGDGEAETGPLAASWHSSKFINPALDGAVLPILHLNGYKISGPTIWGRMSDEDLTSFFKGVGYEPVFVTGDDPSLVHKDFWHTLDTVYDKIKKIQNNYKKNAKEGYARWPMIILKTPKGWTCPKKVDGKVIEGTFRSHQVPISDVVTNSEHLKILERWMRSYKPEELFQEDGNPTEEVLSIVPKKDRWMGLLPYANGGLLLKDLQLPDYTNYKIDVKEPGTVVAEATREAGKYVRDIFKENEESKNFRLFCPDETNSNRFNHVFEVTNRRYLGKVLPSDEALAPDGRVLEVLSEHLCQGWLEGYLLTGRHGIFPCYEAFALIVDSMLNQHAKWLKASRELAWRMPIASLNYLLTSHAWRQDHNGYSHQGPGFIESVLSKKETVARIYLPPDGNCLLSVLDHCFRSREYINLIVCGKQPMLQWLDMRSAQTHCAKGASVWQWASDNHSHPDIILACAGDTPTLEILAARSLLKEAIPDINIRVVNVVDLFRLVIKDAHPHGMDNKEFYQLFPKGVPVVFAFHGHPRVVDELVFTRGEKDRFYVRGYIEEGTTTTPFDMVVCNKMSRYHLAILSLSLLSKFKENALVHIENWEEKLKKHKKYIHEHGQDIPEVLNWTFSK
ncbi:MAG: phosphoketolase [Chlamydiae bacterium CG10_big_fil_rev_8_21_14_0_10_35_9]|nr:MAG: phosphoketolase [Chlamydiae bacterium CG10_big_fil_rev_8_21_14_0_10_35_9]